MNSSARVQRNQVSSLNTLPKTPWCDHKAIEKRLRRIIPRIAPKKSETHFLNLANQLTTLFNRHKSFPLVFLHEINNILAEIELILDGKKPGFNKTKSLSILLKGIIDTYFDIISGEEMYFLPENFRGAVSDTLRQHGLSKYTKVVVRDLEKLGCISGEREAYIRELIQPDISREKAEEIIGSIVGPLPRSKTQKPKPIIIRVSPPPADRVSPEERLANVVSDLEEILLLFEKCHEFGKEYNKISRLSGRILPVEFVSNDLVIRELNQLKQALASPSYNKEVAATSVGHLAKMYFDSVESLADHTVIIEDILKESSLYYAKGQIVLAAFNFLKSEKPEIYQEFLSKFIILSADYGHLEGTITELLAMHAKGRQPNVQIMEANLGITEVGSRSEVEFFDFASLDLATGRYALHEIKTSSAFLLSKFLEQFLGITWYLEQKPFAQIDPLLNPEKFVFPAGSPYPQAIENANFEVQVLSLFSLPEPLRNYQGTQSLGELMANLQRERAALFYHGNIFETPTTRAIQRALSLRMQQIEKIRPELQDLPITFGTIPRLPEEIF